jgi:hypothetical protein
MELLFVLSIISANIELITVLAAIGVNFMLLLAAWVKFKTTLLTTTEDIKNHSDITVQKLNGMLTYVIQSFDRPAWVKVAREENGEIHFRMLEVNDKYTELSGIHRKNYIGRTDLEAGWNHETAKIFHDHDLSVWASGNSKTFDEEIYGTKRKFRRIRIQTNDGTLKGIMCYEIGEDMPSGINTLHKLPI